MLFTFSFYIRSQIFIPMKRWFFPLAYMTIIACRQAPSARQTQDSIKTDSLATATAVLSQLTERDTVTIGNVLYNIIDTDQAEFDATPDYKPSAEKEEENIARFAGKVSRIGDSLMLKLEKDSTIILKNNNKTDGDDYIDFTFLDYIPALNAYLVYAVGYEYFEYHLHDAATGRLTRTIGIPQLSPDKKFFVCSNSDLVASFTTNGFELFRMGKDSIEPVQERQPENWGPVTIKWKDARSFVAHFNERTKELDETDRYVKLVPR